MFQHPDDVMKEEQDNFDAQPSLSPLMDIDQEPVLKLPNFVSEHEPDGLPRITQETLLDVLNDKYREHYDHVKIIDCRFEYEYEGGHIQGALNFNDKQLLTHELFDTPNAASTLLIFHCEYSVHRAPLTAKHIRGEDRTVNAASYPALTYPEMYILDGGYSKFFQNHRSKCFPQNYVEMNDQRHEQDCERRRCHQRRPRPELPTTHGFILIYASRTSTSSNCTWRGVRDSGHVYSIERWILTSCGVLASHLIGFYLLGGAQRAFQPGVGGSTLAATPRFLRLFLQHGDAHHRAF
jgi:rhodanese-related sulfurtransferase